MSSGKDRVTVTLDRALLEAATAAVEAGRAHSVSAVVNSALAEYVAKERHLAVLSELVAAYEAEHGAITAAELAARERDDRRNALVIRGAAKPRKGRSRAA